MNASKLRNKLDELIEKFGDQEVWVHTHNGSVFRIDSNILPDADNTSFIIDIDDRNYCTCSKCTGIESTEDYYKEEE